MYVKKTFSIAARWAAAIVEFIALLIFALPFGFVFGVLIASYFNI